MSTEEDYCEIGAVKHETEQCNGALRDVTLTAGPRTVANYGRTIRFDAVTYTVTVCEAHFATREQWMPKDME